MWDDLQQKQKLLKSILRVKLYGNTEEKIIKEIQQKLNPPLVDPNWLSETIESLLNAEMKSLNINLESEHYETYLPNTWLLKNQTISLLKNNDRLEKDPLHQKKADVFIKAALNQLNPEDLDGIFKQIVTLKNPTAIITPTQAIDIINRAIDRNGSPENILNMIKTFSNNAPYLEQKSELKKIVIYPFIEKAKSSVLGPNTSIILIGLLSDQTLALFDAKAFINTIDILAKYTKKTGDASWTFSLLKQLQPSYFQAYNEAATDCKKAVLEALSLAFDKADAEKIYSTLKEIAQNKSLFAVFSLIELTPILEKWMDLAFTKIPINDYKWFIDKVWLADRMFQVHISNPETRAIIVKNLKQLNDTSALTWATRDVLKFIIQNKLYGKTEYKFINEINQYGSEEELAKHINTLLNAEAAALGITLDSVKK